MVILKRLVVWLPERLVEAFLLGALLGYLLVPNLTRFLSDVWGFALAVGVVLFIHGFYVTTALFGVIWRSEKLWVYSAITAALFIIHTHIAFLRLKANFTPEAKAMELPFLLGGACIVFGCALAGGRVLRKWLTAGSSTNPYMAATTITLLLFTLANTAHFLRPVVGDTAFRQYGIPFTLYHEGGFVGNWVWHRGEFVWSGIIADAALVVGIIVLFGKVWQRIDAGRAR